MKTNGGFTLKTRAMWIAGLMTATVLCASAVARAQEPQPLLPGLNLERTLGPGEKHVYTITLQEGAAITGAAEQHGDDLVIDISVPDRKAIRTVELSAVTAKPLGTSNRSKGGTFCC